MIFIQKISKFFKMSCFIIVLHQIIVGNQEQFPKMLYADFDSDEIIPKNEYVGDGFLQGTLVETMKGCVPIEQIAVGDYLVDLEGVQEVLSVKKGKVDRYVRLLISNGECVCAAMHQDFYLDNKNLHPAAGLCPGYRLLNGLYIVDNEFIHEPCNCYSLTTEHHAYFIYPETLVHNFNPVIVGALGSYVIGTVEVANVVNIMLGAIASLSCYASQYFRSKIVYNYEFNEEDSKLTIEQLCLQNSDVLQQTRNYFDTKRRLLNNLHQDLIKVKSDVSVFVRPNNLHSFDFSFGLLSQYKPAPYNLLGLIPLASEMALSLADKEKIMKMRQADLDKLQQDIFDTHLTLVLHITELIDRKNIAQQQLNDIYDQIVKIVKLRNQNIYNGPTDLLFTDYQTHFIWKEMLDNLALKTNELQFVMSYYERLKSHFFMTKTTNFINIFNQQRTINKNNLESIEKNSATWWSNMCIIEDCLKQRNLLTKKLVDQYQFAAQQYRAERDSNPIIFAQKRIDDIKKQFNKESEDKKKGGGGGPEQDPDNEPSGVLGYFTAAIAHIFREKEGHLIDTPEHRKLLLDMALKAKNYAGETIVKQTGTIKLWYGKILPDGRQLWVWVKDGLIRDGGINKIPRSFDPDTGFCFNPFKN